MKKIYQLLCASCIMFLSGSYNGTPALIYSTYFGGQRMDADYNWLNRFSTDEDGSIYIALHTYSQDFPVTPDAYDTTYNGGNNWGGEDLAIVRFNTTTNTLVYASYFGGSEGPEVVSQVFKSKNNLYLTGNTGAADFPVTDGALDATFNGPDFRHADGFFSAFRQNELWYSSYIGTSGNEWTVGVSENKQGEIVVAGTIAKVAEIEAMYRFYIEDSRDVTYSSIYRFSPQLDSLLSITVIGPGELEDMQLDAEGYIYITGKVTHPAFPVTAGAFDTTFNTNGETSDLFLTKLTPSGDEIVFSTLLGGSGEESNAHIGLDANGNIFVYGRTRSTDFPLTDNALDKEFDGESELFIAKISNDGATLSYASYLGGNESQREYPGNLVVTKGRVYVCGATDADDHPVTPDAIQQSLQGESDLFITGFYHSFSQMTFSTYLGGSADDRDIMINTDTDGGIVGIGSSNSPDFPTTPNAYATKNHGARDLVIFKIGWE